MTSSRRSYILLLVLASIVISTALGLRQSLGLFMQPMVAGFGISAASFGFAIALQNLVWGVSQPLVGALADRHGARPVVMGTALVIPRWASRSCSFANAFPRALQIAGFLTGIGIAGTGFGVLIGTGLARRAPGEAHADRRIWSQRQARSGRWSIAPLATGTHRGFGWKAPDARVCRDRGLDDAVRAADPRAGRCPRSRVRGSGSPARHRATRPSPHRGYLFMTLAFFACGFQLVFITAYLPSHLALCGVAPGVGATALAAHRALQRDRHLLFGLLGARYSQKRLLAIIYLAAHVCHRGVPRGCRSPPTTTLVFAAAMGLLWLGVVPLVTGIIGRMFGLAYFNTLYGIAFLSHQVGSFVGAWMGGVVFDRTARYDIAWAAFIAIGIVAFVLQWAMGEEPPRQRTSRRRRTCVSAEGSPPGANTPRSAKRGESPVNAQGRPKREHASKREALREFQRPAQ